VSTNRGGQKIVWVIEGVNEWDAVGSDLIHQRWQNLLSHQDLVFGDDSRPVVVKDVADAIHAEKPGQSLVDSLIWVVQIFCESLDVHQMSMSSCCGHQEES
jgi:hypothetical protein